MHRLFVRIGILSLASLCFSSHAGEVDIKKLHKTQWRSLDTANFSIITDATEKKALAMAEDLEQFYLFVSVSLGYDQSPLANRVPVILAKRTATFSAMGVPKEYGGVFLSRPALDEYVIFANASKFSSAEDGRQSSGRSIILHELMHLINRNETIGLASPPWYNEGVAEYFGTYVQKKDRIILGDLSLLQYRFISLLTPTGRFQDIQTESLFKTTQQELPISEDTSRGQNHALSEFYARSAAVVHYLNADPERRRQMYLYLKLVHKGYNVDESFDYAFNMTFEELDERVDDYLNSRFVMARTFPVGAGGIEFPEVPYSARLLDPKEAMQILISKIGLFNDSFLGEGNREKMNADIDTLYPDLF